MLKRIRKTIIFLLTAAMLISILPVTAEAKKLGKVEAFFAPEDPYDWDGETWKLNSLFTFYCKPGDTFTLTSDAIQEEIEDIKSALNMKTDGKITWHTSDPEVATVNQKGKVTVKGEGVTAITVTCMVTAKALWPGAKWETSENTIFRHWIRSGSDKVYDLKKSNVKSVAKKWYSDYLNSAIRVKGTLEDNEELFLALMDEIRKLNADEINKGTLTWNDTAHFCDIREIDGRKTLEYRTSEKGSRASRFFIHEIGDFCYTS